MQRKELIQLINAYFDGNLEAAELQRLEAELKTSVEAQKLYWKYARLHGSIEEAWSGLNQAEPEEFKVPEVVEVPMSAIDEAADVFNSRHSHTRTIRRRKSSRVSTWTGWAMAAALLMSLGVGTWYIAVVYNTTVAVIVASVDAKWDVAPSTGKDGKSLNRGELKLRSGLVRIRMHSGAEVVLEGPATLRLDGENVAYLKTGKLAADVPPEAYGFTINTRTIRVVDLGTQFGVDASNPDIPEVHVFKGIVKAGLIENNSGATPRSSLTTGRATRFDSVLKTETPVVISKARFARDLVRRRINLHNTGERIAGGGRDMHWRVVPLLPTPGPAVAAAGAFQHAIYQPNSRQSSWISARTTAVSYVAGYTAAFETTFDMTGLDLKTALIEARVLADDIVVAYELNGVRRSLPMTFNFHLSHRGFRSLPISGRLLPGRNTLRFIVKNVGSQFAFRAELNGTAQSIAKRGKRDR
jgi:hypothetical protein